MIFTITSFRAARLKVEEATDLVALLAADPERLASVSGDESRMAGSSGGPWGDLRLNISKADMEAPSWRLAAARLFRLS